MEDLVKILKDAPPQIKDKARTALLAVVDEYEDWKSQNQSDAKRYDLVNSVCNAGYPPSVEQNVVRKSLRSGKRR